MTKLFNFTVAHYSSLCKHKIPLDAIFILEMIKEELPIDNEDFMSTLQKLQRKGYVDMKGILTSYGEELYQSFHNPVSEEIKVKKRIITPGDKFEQWWEVYPASNYFTINNREFQGTQNKRIKKEECRKLFNVLCSSEYNSDEVIKATAFHIKTAMELSFKTKQNQLSYIPNSERYLREKYFAPYIDKIKKQEVAKTGDFEI